MKLQRLLSLTRQALDTYGLIQDGDRIAIGVSGGKAVCFQRSRYRATNDPGVVFDWCIHLSFYHYTIKLTKRSSPLSRKIGSKSELIILALFVPPPAVHLVKNVASLRVS